MESVLGAAGPPGPGTPGDLGSATPPVSPRRVWWEIVALICLVGAAYGQTLSFDFVWDDPTLVLFNPALRGLIGWRDVFTSPASVFLPLMQGAERMYRPLLTLSVAVDRALWGLHPGGFHLLNVLAHAAVVLLLWRLAWWLTGSRAAAFAAGALLAVHPSAVEAISFIGARADLFVALGIAAVLLLLRSWLRPGAGWRLAGALLAFALALGWKETAMAIPPLITWVACASPQWFAGPAPPVRRATAVVRVGLFWVVLGLYAALRHAVVGSFSPIPIGLADLPPQVPRALVAVATYAEMTLIPRPTTGYIRVESPMGLTDPRVVFGAAVVVLLATGLLVFRRRQPAAALALGWYAAALVPASNLLPIYSTQATHIAERSLYPALVGWCLFLGVGVDRFQRLGASALGRSPAVVKAMSGAVLGTLLVVTAVKAGAWRDDLTLWTASVISDPGSVLARTNLAAAQARVGDLEAAQASVQDTQARFPGDPAVASQAGMIAELRGDFAEALREYERAIDLGASQPVTFRQAALLAARLQDWDRAGRWFGAAAERYRQAAWPEMGLGWDLARRGRPGLATAHFARAGRLEPASAEAHWVLGQLLAAEGRPGEAARAYENALARDPFYAPARRELALLFEQAGRIAEAIDQWRRIAAAGPWRFTHRREALGNLHRLEAKAGGQSPGGPR